MHIKKTGWQYRGSEQECTKKKKETAFWPRKSLQERQIYAFWFLSNMTKSPFFFGLNIKRKRKEAGEWTKNNLCKVSTTFNTNINRQTVWHAALYLRKALIIFLQQREEGVWRRVTSSHSALAMLLQETLHTRWRTFPFAFMCPFSVLRISDRTLDFSLDRSSQHWFLAQCLWTENRLLKTHFGFRFGYLKTKPCAALRFINIIKALRGGVCAPKEKQYEPIRRQICLRLHFRLQVIQEATLLLISVYVSHNSLHQTSFMKTNGRSVAIKLTTGSFRTVMANVIVKINISTCSF